MAPKDVKNYRLRSFENFFAVDFINRVEEFAFFTYLKKEERGEKINNM